MLYLFFVPGSNLFNITYISYNSSETSNGYKYTDDDKIIINSNAYDVQVAVAEGDSIFAKVYSNSLGFTLLENSKVNIDTKCAGRKLQIDVTEPHGFALKNNSLITLYIPEGYTSAIEFNNNSAKTTLNVKNLTFVGLTYKTIFGDLNLENGTFDGSLKIDIGNATCSISESATTKTNDVTLKIAEGKFDAPNKDFNNFTIESNNRGVVIFGSCQMLKQTSSENAGGRIEINTLYDSNYISGDTNVNIKNLYKGNVTLKKSGSIVVENCIGNASYLTTDTGSITVNNAEADVFARTYSGNVVIDKANNNISINSSRGTTTVNFKDDAGDRCLNAETRDGTINVTGVDVLVVKATGNNGSVNAVMNDVKNGCNIKTIQGNVNIIFKDGDQFTLYTTQQNGGSFFFEDLETPIPITSIPADGKIVVNKDAANVSFIVTTTQGGSIHIVDKSMASI
ncbi:MAG: hypothetical protein MJ152_03510 [Clostridia bacterium]|nr:hypothetical protein [Clostridia bacterium]